MASSGNELAILPPPLPGTQPLGICYGTRTNHIPPRDWVVNNEFREDLNTSKVMFCNTDDNVKAVLDLMMESPQLPPASTWQVVLCVATSELVQFADVDHARTWVSEYVERYKDIITYICVGVLSQLNTSCDFQNFAFAINNIKAHVPNNIKVTTMVGVSMFASSYNADTLPSLCKFDDRYKCLMDYVVIPILKASSAPLFAKVIPYFQISSTEPCLCPFLISQDAPIYMVDSFYSYRYVYDAMLDAIHCAVNRCACDDEPPIYVVTGWPTKGVKPAANLQNQRTYIANLPGHVQGGTPRIKRPIENYVYCLVDEENNPRPELEWKHLGIRQPPA